MANAETHALPRPTTDVAQAGWHLAVHGYCILADVLTNTELTGLRDRVEAVAAAERADGSAWIDSDGCNQRIYNMTNKGDEFFRFATHPTTLGMVTDLLGGRVLLSSLTTNIAGRGGPPMYAHQDGGYVPYPQPPYPMVANVAWFLDDVDETNGGTQFIPGSHLWERPLREQEPAEWVTPSGRAGSAVIFDGRAWHRTGTNQTGADRRVVLTYYCRPFLRQQENPFLSLSPDVAARLPDQMRHLLGFSRHGSLGGVNGARRPDDGPFVDRPAY